MEGRRSCWYVPPKVWHSRPVFLFYQLAIPHLLHVEDEYKGYRLPAGSIIIPNAWSVPLVPFIQFSDNLVIGPCFITKTSILILSPSIRIDSLARTASSTNQVVILRMHAGASEGGMFRELDSHLYDPESFLGSVLDDIWHFPPFGSQWPLYSQPSISRKLWTRMEI